METRKILIVDDDISVLEFIVSIFEKYQPNYEIYQTSNSNNAHEIAKKTLPDLIITDWQMPVFSGIELIKQLKNEPSTYNIPIIIATGIMNSSSDLQVALDAGAVDFVTKPFDPIELVARAESAISIAKNHQKSIETKNQELAENTLYLIKNKEFVSKLKALVDDLKKVSKETDTYQKEIIKRIEELISSKVNDDSSERFSIAFYSVHEHFNKNLMKSFPNLTKGDIRLCAFLRLGLSTKDIASLLYQEIDSIKVSRSRLRKKLGLDQCQNLQAFLSAF